MKRKVKRNKEERIANVINYLFNIDYFNVLCRCIYGMIFFSVSALALAGIANKLFNGYFEAIVLTFIFAICFYIGDKKISNLPIIFAVPMFFICLGLILQAAGVSSIFVEIGKHLLIISGTCSICYLILKIFYRLGVIK